MLMFFAFLHVLLVEHDPGQLLLGLRGRIVLGLVELQLLLDILFVIICIIAVVARLVIVVSIGVIVSRFVSFVLCRVFLLIGAVLLLADYSGFLPVERGAGACEGATLFHGGRSSGCS